MASSSLCNFLSFLLPSQPSQSKNPPTQLIISSTPLSTLSSSSSSSTSLHSQRNRNAFVLVVEYECSSLYSNDFLSVICPSLVYANTLFFKSAYNVQIIVGEDESEEALLRRFRREVMKAGVIQESKRRRFFESKQEEKKRRTREAAKRNRKRRPWRPPPPDKQEASKNEKNEDEEDNWELPEGDLPY